MVQFFRDANKGNGLAAVLTGDAAASDELQREWEMALPTERVREWARLDGSAPGSYQQLNQMLGPFGGLAGVIQRQGLAGTGFGPEAVDVNAALQPLVLSAHIASPNIVLGCLHLIAKVASAQSDTNRQRVHYGPTWEQYFQEENTHYILDGVDLTQALRVNLATVPAAGQEAYLLDLAGSEDAYRKLLAHLSDADKSAFQRLAESGSISLKRRGGQVDSPVIIRRGSEVDGDDWGLLYASFMMLSSYSRIPDYLLQPAQRAALTDPVRVQDAAATWSYVQLLLNAHKRIEAPEKKLRRDAASRQTRLERRAAQGRTTSPRSASPARSRA
jgi:hypothetical protein